MRVKDVGQEIQRLKEVIIGQYRPEKIILFGSAAQDETGYLSH